MHITSDLLARLNNNEPTAHAELFDATFSELTLFVFRMIDNQEQSEDIAIVALRKLFGRNNITFEAVEQLKSYLYKSVRNGALNYIRSVKKDDPFRKQLQAEMPASEEPGIYRKYEVDHMRKLVETVLNGLEKQVAAVIRLTMENMPSDEIAKKLNISPNQVYTQRSKGIKQLQKLLEEKGDKYGIPVVIVLLIILCKLYFG